MFIDAWKDAGSETSVIQKALQKTISVWLIIEALIPGGKESGWANSSGPI